MFQANILPGQGFIPFNIWRANNAISGSGRAISGKPADTKKKITGILTNASQKEIDQWKQKGFPITHKITQYGAETKAQESDYLVGNGAEYYVRGKKNPGNLNVTMIYYVEERHDLKRTDAQ